MAYFSILFNDDLSLRWESINQHWQSIAAASEQDLQDITNTLRAALLDNATQAQKEQFIARLLEIAYLPEVEIQIEQKAFFFCLFLSAFNAVSLEEQKTLFSLLHAQNNISTLIYYIIYFSNDTVFTFLRHMAQFFTQSPSEQFNYFVREMIYNHRQRLYRMEGWDNYDEVTLKCTHFMRHIILLKCAISVVQPNHTIDPQAMSNLQSLTQEIGDLPTKVLEREARLARDIESSLYRDIPRRSFYDPILDKIKALVTAFYITHGVPIQARPPSVITQPLLPITTSSARSVTSRHAWNNSVMNPDSNNNNSIVRTPNHTSNSVSRPI